MKLAFTKMQGCANDYIYLDCRSAGMPPDIAGLAQKLSARRFSIGGDGVICICAPQSPDADATMRIFNADGSEGMMCGNGIRCVAEWLYTHEPACAGKDLLRIDTRSGQKQMRRCGPGLWQVEMGRYSAMAADLPGPLHSGSRWPELAGHLHQRGQSPLRDGGGGRGRVEPGGHRPVL